MSEESIAESGELIRAGKLVSFPTETVYGLGADATNADACLLIFKTKGRPLTDPLITHVSSVEWAKSLLQFSESSLEALFDKLAAAYWPGPITLVAKSNPLIIPDLITAGTGFVGVRIPKHDVARQLIEAAGKPIAAPSANKFGHVSPTKAEHVLKDFKNDEVLVLDGGQCPFGIESTVLKIQLGKSQQPEVVIFRRGGISEKSLRATLQDQGVAILTLGRKAFKEESENLEAPGQFLKHYAPDISSYLVKPEFEVAANSVENAILFDFQSLNGHLKDRVALYVELSQKGDFLEAIQNIYDLLRWAETQTQCDKLLITDVCDSSFHSEEEHKEAFFDRVFRATCGQYLA